MNLSDKRPLIMGIVNVTPDSFSGDGVMQQKDFVIAAAKQATQMIQDGADILDIGGESSRPGATPISVEEETDRVVPVITAIKKAHPDIPIAIDTIKSRVAGAAIGVGASIVNDITAMKADADMMKYVDAYDVHVVLMHNRTNPLGVTHDKNLGGEYDPANYAEVIDDVASYLAERIETAKAAGIPHDKIIVDPGLGFGKTVEQNCALINKLDLIKERLGCPVLIGPSRKSFVGKALNLPVDARLEGTAAAVAVGVVRGADIVRVHDVQFMARVAAMAHFIANSKR